MITGVSSLNSKSVSGYNQVIENIWKHIKMIGQNLVNVIFKCKFNVVVKSAGSGFESCLLSPSHLVGCVINGK